MTKGGVSTIWAGREGKVDPEIKDVMWQVIGKEITFSDTMMMSFQRLMSLLFPPNCFFPTVVTALFPLLRSTVVEAVSSWLLDAALGSWSPVPSVLQSRSKMKREKLQEPDRNPDNLYLRNLQLLHLPVAFLLQLVNRFDGQPQGNECEYFHLWEAPFSHTL